MRPDCCEVGEVFGINLGERFRIPHIDHALQCTRCRVAGVVPSAECCDYRWAAECRLGKPFDVRLRRHSLATIQGAWRRHGSDWMRTLGFRRMATIVEIAASATDEIVAAMGVLIPQLSSSNPPPTHSDLESIISSESSVLFIARVDGHIVGSLTLATFRIPTGIRAWIEDVVVDEAARGHGVGEALNRAALDEARRRGAITVELTSRPSREAANRLYLRLGFVQRETNVYRYSL